MIVHRIVFAAAYPPRAADENAGRRHDAGSYAVARSRGCSWRSPSASSAQIGPAYRQRMGCGGRLRHSGNSRLAGAVRRARDCGGAGPADGRIDGPGQRPQPQDAHCPVFAHDRHRHHHLHGRPDAAGRSRRARYRHHAACVCRSCRTGGGRCCAAGAQIPDRRDADGDYRTSAVGRSGGGGRAYRAGGGNPHELRHRADLGRTRHRGADGQFPGTEFRKLVATRAKN